MGPPSLSRSTLFASASQGDLTFTEFNEVADQAVLEALRCQDEAGVDMVSDGEQRRDNFYSFVVEKLDGVKLMALGEIMDYVEDKEAFDQILRSQDAPSFAIHNATRHGQDQPGHAPGPGRA